MMVGDLGHQRPDGVMGAHHPVGLLTHAQGVLRAQHHPRPALVGLQLVQGGLELPAPRVQCCQFGGGGNARVEQRGYQPVTLRRRGRPGSSTA